MPLVIVLLLLAPFAAPAQVFPADAGDMVPLLSRPALPRGGLVAGWDLRTPNIAERSEQLDNAYWSIKNRVTVAANNAESPDGSLTAETITETATTGTHEVLTVAPVLTSGVSYTFSLHAKAATVTRVGLVLAGAAFSGGGNGFAAFNLATCEVLTTSGGAAALASVSTSGYCRLAVSKSAASTSSIFGVQLLDGSSATSYEGSADNSVIAWGAMINSGTTPGPYVATGDLQSVPNMVPGGAALQRGSAAGADTNDPGVSAAGWVFDGVDDYGIGPSGLTFANTAASIILVASNTSDSAWRGAVAVGDVISLTANNAAYIQAPTTAGRWVAGHKRGAEPTARNGVTEGQLNMHALVYGGGVINQYFAGALHSTVAVNGVSACTTCTLFVGDDWNAPLKGTISYVLIYNRSLSPVEIKRLHERYLKPKMAEVSVVLP